MEASYQRVTLVEPTDFGYIHLAAEVDERLPFLPYSRRKRDLVEECKRRCVELRGLSGVRSAVVFRAVLVPPGKGAYLEAREGEVHVARFDLALLVETDSMEEAERLRRSDAFQELEEAVRAAASYAHVVTASNAMRIGAVDHDQEGVFLFNYFVADSTEQNLEVWEKTAGWFQQETGLDNSTLLLPAEGEGSQYNIINHCRWDHLRDILPSLLLKPSFRTYVLASFETSRVAAIPIFYELA